MNAIDVMGAVASGQNESRKRAIENINTSIALDSNRRLNEKHAWDMKQLADQEKVDSTFMPMGDANWVKQNAEVVKQMTSVAGNSGLASEFKVDETGAYATGRYAKALQKWFITKDSLEGNMMKAMDRDLQRQLFEVESELTGDGKTKVNEKRAAELTELKKGIQAKRASIMTQEQAIAKTKADADMIQAMKPAKEAENTVKVWGRSPDGSQIFSDERGNTYKNIQGKLTPYQTTKSDKSEGQLSAAEGRSSTSTHIYPPKTSDTRMYMDEYNAFGPTEKAHWAAIGKQKGITISNAAEYADYKMSYSKAKAGGENNAVDRVLGKVKENISK